MARVDESELKQLAQDLGVKLQAREWRVATAESCTGGLVGQLLTSLPGCSSWFERGFITYSNVSKQEMLGVLETTLETFGAVSEETASEMAKGALAHSHAHVSLSITGIAGPDGGTEQTPVGTVCFALSADGVLVSATAVDFPTRDRHDQQINSYAIPILQSETVDAQGSAIDMVSGATVTSRAYIQSLQDALDQAGL